MNVFTDVRIENGSMIVFTAPIETSWDTIEKELEDRYVKGYKEFEWRWRGFKLDEKKEWSIRVWKNPMVDDSDDEEYCYGCDNYDTGCVCDEKSDNDE